MPLQCGAKLLLLLRGGAANIMTSQQFWPEPGLAWTGVQLEPESGPVPGLAPGPGLGQGLEQTPV